MLRVTLPSTHSRQVPHTAHMRDCSDRLSSAYVEFPRFFLRLTQSWSESLLLPLSPRRRHSKNGRSRTPGILTGWPCASQPLFCRLWRCCYRRRRKQPPDHETRSLRDIRISMASARPLMPPGSSAVSLSRFHFPE